MKVVLNEKHLLQEWTQESLLFRQMFGGLSTQQLDEEAVTSGCKHSLGQHITCIMVWMEAGISYTQARWSYNCPWPDIGGKVLDYTNRLLMAYEGVSYPDIWLLLENIEGEYQELVAQYSHLIFSDKESWDWVVWTSVAHYHEHRLELEWQLAGLKNSPPEKKWTNPHLLG